MPVVTRPRRGGGCLRGSAAAAAVPRAYCVTTRWEQLAERWNQARISRKRPKIRPSIDVFGVSWVRCFQSARVRAQRSPRKQMFRGFRFGGVLALAWTYTGAPKADTCVGLAAGHGSAAILCALLLA